jgi:hypothetical protein
LREIVAQTLQQIDNVLKTQLRIFTMKKSVLTVALATAALSLTFSGSANADLKWNGIQWNGVRLKAVVLPDTSMQPTKLQGMELQSLKVEGGQLVGVTRVAAE